MFATLLKLYEKNKSLTTKGKFRIVYSHWKKKNLKFLKIKTKVIKKGARTKGH